MIPDLDRALAVESKFDLDRIEKGLPPWGTGSESTSEPENPEYLQLASRNPLARPIKEFFSGLSNMAKTKTDDILDARAAKTAEKPVVPEKGLTPEDFEHIEAVLQPPPSSADKLPGIKQYHEVDTVEVMDAVNNKKVPTEKRTDTRNINIERHHEGARQAVNKTFEQVENADDMAKMLDKMSEQLGGKKSRTFKQIEKNVSSMEDVITEMRPVYEGTQKGLLTDQQNYAARVLSSTIFNNTQELAKKITAGDASNGTQASFMRASEQLVALNAYISNNASETGRALNAQNMIGRALEKQTLEDMQKAMKDLGGPKEIKAQAKLLKLLAKEEENGNGGAYKKFLNTLDLVHRKGGSITLEYWKAQLLSGLPTHIVNVTGSLMQNGWDTLLIKPTAAMIGESRKGIGKLTGNKVVDYVSAQEAIATASMGFMTLRDSGKMMFRALRENEGRFASTGKGHEGQVGDFENFSKFFFGEKLGKGASDTLLAPYRVLGAEDELGKAIAYRQELGGLSVRQSINEGLTGKQMLKRSKELQDVPSQEMHDGAMDFARRTTFQDEINGPILGLVIKSLKDMEKEFPLVGAIIPFKETPTNIVKRVFELSPAVALSSKLHKQIAKGGAEADIAKAKMMWGVGLFMSVYMAHESGVLSGPGPDKWEVRETMEKSGWRPNAVKVGDSMFGIERFAPHSQAMGMLTTYLDGVKYANTEAEAAEALASGVLIVGDNVTNMPFMQGFSNVMDASSGHGNAVKKFAASTGAGMIPFSGALKTVKGLIDPVQRRVTQDKHAQSGVMDATMQTAKARLPGLSSNLRPARYWDGTVKQPDAYEMAWAMTGVKYGKKQELDRVNGELIAQQYTPKEPSPLITISGLEFSFAEMDSGEGKIYDAYIVKVGKMRRDFFKEAMASKDYQALESGGEDGERGLILKRANAHATKAAKMDFIVNDLPDLLAESDSLSDIGREIFSERNIEAWVENTMESYEEIVKDNPDYKKSVRSKRHSDSKSSTQPWEDHEEKMQMGPLN